MSRRSAEESAEVSLFPFLAVLLCTMGSLLLLLIVIVRHVQRQNVREAALAATEQVPDEELAAQIDELRWRVERLREAQAATADQLADEQTELSHWEEHARRLRSQLDELLDSQEQLAAGVPDPDRLKELHERLAKLEAQIAAAQAELDRLERDPHVQPASYAILPYDGKHGTQRRPIYLECRADSVVFQPEGVVLTEADFAGEMGPANPLAAGVRAAAEQRLEASPQSVPVGQRPYPLLLVRPDGIGAYYAARAALASWGDDFGYELVGADWKLAFPAPEPNIEHAIARAVDDARQGLLPMPVRRTPREFASRERQGYRVPGRGALVPQPGQGSLTIDTPAFGSGNSGSASADPGGHASGDSAAGAEGGGFSGGDGGDSQLAGSAAGGEYGSDIGGEYGSEFGSEFAGSEYGGQSGGESSAGGTQDAGASAAASGQGASSELGQASAGGGQRGSQGDSAQGSPAQAGGAPQATAQQAAQSGGQPLHLGESRLDSLADRRGANWALPNAAQGAVPVTRPIAIRCTADRLEILSDRDSRRVLKTLEFKGATTSVVDDLVSAIWDYIASWGIAGRGLYWRPVLNLNVVPGGEARAQELSQLLEGSGLEVRVRVQRPPRSSARSQGVSMNSQGGRRRGQDATARGVGRLGADETPSARFADFRAGECALAAAIPTRSVSEDERLHVFQQDAQAVRCLRHPTAFSFVALVDG